MEQEYTWHVGPYNLEAKKKGGSDVGTKIFWEDSDWAAKEKKNGHGKVDGSNIYFFCFPTIVLKGEKYEN